MAANTGRRVSQQHVLLLVLLKACLLGGRVLGASSSSSFFFSTESPENPDYIEYHDYEDSPHCEPLEAEECQGLGYDTTLFPNLLNHRSQDAALEELKELIPLIEVECSEVLREFLCSLYMPVCTNYGFHLPPCRALCRQAREECEQAMLSDGLKWPDKFDCTRYPEHHELMCVLSLNHSKSAERSVCRAGECVCEYPRTWGPYGCEETQILGGQCTNDNQCSTVTPNAVCRDNKCACISPLTSYMNLACIHASGVGSLCYNDAQCRAVNTYSFCRFLVSQVVGTCACDPDQFIDIHGRCAPRLGGRCKRGTCSRKLGVASCQRGRESVLKCFCRKKAVQRRGVCVLR
ncbi:secreted frizzled-related protein 2-like [Penaeus indicus]|uniref:secreted frizzled-related protein 2-like n=1 Tax=Penaeus indicus TaxID=29960 RepID=UPI00300DAD0B